jgi:hypothetical protein
MSEKSAHSSGSGSGKEVLYIDVEDEITAIIDKVHASKQKIVALVLPKRATVLQSIVNMKLLKRAADGGKKNIVLITSEAGLLPLAGTVGLHVARSLQSKPEIPDGPGHPGSSADADEDDDEAEALDDEAEVAGAAAAASKAGRPDRKLDKNRSVGELAGAAALDGQLDESDNIDLDNDSDEPVAAAAGERPKKGKNKKLMVPNFNRFRMLIIFGGVGLVALIIFLFMAVSVLPKASIAITTDSSAVTSSSAMILKSAPGTQLDEDTGVIPSTVQEVKKTASQQVAATGQRNNGEKASGTMKITNCTSSPVTIPAGSGVTAGGLTFITQTSLVLSDGNFTSGGSCKSTGGHIGTVGVVSQQGGAQYNVAARSDYTIGGFPGVSGAGSAMEGGTDNITKIVTQGDIDGAKQKLATAETDAIKQELKSGLVTKDLYAIDMSFKASDPAVKTSANAGDAAENVTVTQDVTYSMQGVETKDLEKLIKDEVGSKIDLKKQTILDYGLADAVFTQQSANADGMTITYQTTVVVGSELDETAIKKQVAGKKAGEAERLIKQYPGVTEVEVTYSPFWVSKIPGKTDKITVDVEKPKAPTRSSNATNP